MLAYQARWALVSPEMNHLYHYKRDIARAENKKDADTLRIIVWYLTDYWPATNETSHSSLHQMHEVATMLRQARNRKNVSQFFTTATFNEVERFQEVLSRKNLNTITGYQEIIHEIYFRPEASPIMEHLICDRGILDWNDIKPMINDLLKAESKPLLSGVL
jgi:hypothetical protein